MNKFVKKDYYSMDPEYTTATIVILFDFKFEKLLYNQDVLETNLSFFLYKYIHIFFSDRYKYLIEFLTTLY